MPLAFTQEDFLFLHNFKQKVLDQGLSTGGVLHIFLQRIQTQSFGFYLPKFSSPLVEAVSEPIRREDVPVLKNFPHTGCELE